MCAHDRCHHVSGCVYVTHTSLVSTLYQGDEIYISDKQSVLPTRSQRTPFIDSTTGETSTFQGLLRREIIVYFICTGFVSFILLVCTFLLRRYKQRSANNLPFPSGASPEQIETDIDLHVQATGTSTEAIYETIDESSLIPNLPMSMHARNESNENSGSSSDDNSDPLPNDGYLNPYQPKVQ